MFFSLLFNIYMRLAGEPICHHGIRYPPDDEDEEEEDDDDSQLYLSGPGKLNNGVVVLSWDLEAVRV